MKLWKSKKSTGAASGAAGTTTTSCVPGSGSTKGAGILAKTCKFNSSSTNGGGSAGNGSSLDDSSAETSFINQGPAGGPSELNGGTGVPVAMVQHSSGNIFASK